MYECSQNMKASVIYFKERQQKHTILHSVDNKDIYTVALCGCKTLTEHVHN